MKIVNKVALITGSARRIGRAIGECLHTQGYNIVIHYRQSCDESLKLEQHLNSLRADSAMRVQCDLNETFQFPKMIECIHTKWQRLDLLVNNASDFFATPVDEVSIENWNHLFDINVKAPYFLIQSAHALLAQHQGAVINISDIHGERPLKNYSVYSMTKAALHMLTLSLAKELAPKIRVNAVAPGAIAWPEGENELNLQQKSDIIDKTLLKMHGSPVDIAQAVLYLAQANYVTGQIIKVDGGRG